MALHKSHQVDQDLKSGYAPFGSSRGNAPFLCHLKVAEAAQIPWLMARPLSSKLTTAGWLIPRPRKSNLSPQPLLFLNLPFSLLWLLRLFIKWPCQFQGPAPAAASADELPTSYKQSYFLSSCKKKKIVTGLKIKDVNVFGKAFCLPKWEGMYGTNDVDSFIMSKYSSASTMCPAAS